MSTEITCPACGTVSHFDELARDAMAFCRTCDYPLFWTRTAQLATASTGSGNGLRRLPGTAGRVTIATLDCPVCTEPNPVTATICIRCGAELHPAPHVEPAPPPPEPTEVFEAPAPPPPPRLVWPWIVLGAAAVAALVVLLVLLLT